MPFVATTGAASNRATKFAQEAYYASVHGQNLEQANFEESLVLYGTPRRKILPGVTVNNVFANKLLSTGASNATTLYGLNNTYYTTSTSNLVFAGSIWEGYADDEQITETKVYVADSNVISNGTVFKDAPYSNSGTILSKFYTPSSTQGKLIEYTLNNTGAVVSSTEIDSNYYYGGTPWSIADVIYQQDFESESGYGLLSSLTNLVQNPSIEVTPGLTYGVSPTVISKYPSSGKAIALNSSAVTLDTLVSGGWTLEFSIKVDRIPPGPFYEAVLLSISSGKIQLIANNLSSSQNYLDNDWTNRNIIYYFRSTASGNARFQVDLSSWKNISINCSSQRIAKNTDGTYRQVRVFADGLELSGQIQANNYVMSYSGELGYKGNLDSITFLNAASYRLDNIRLSKAQKYHANHVLTLPFARPAGSPAVVVDSYWSGIIYQQSFNGLTTGASLTTSWPNQKPAGAALTGPTDWTVSSTGYSGKSIRATDYVPLASNRLDGPGSSDCTIEYSLKVDTFQWEQVNFSTSQRVYTFLDIGGKMTLRLWVIISGGSYTKDDFGLFVNDGGSRYVDLHNNNYADDLQGAGWVHLAVSKRAGITRLFINGHLIEQAGDIGNIDYIGLPSAGSLGTFTADATHIDNLRISNFAQYEDDYTPSFPFPES